MVARCIASASGCNRYILRILGRLLRVDLITLDGVWNVPSVWVGTSVRTSVRPSTKRFSDFSEIWYVDRGRGLMHDGMPYDPTQGQGQGHGASEVLSIALFKVYLPRHLEWELASDHRFLN